MLRGAFRVALLVLLSLASCGGYREDDRDSDCRCSPARFRVTVGVDPSLGVEHAFVITVCRGAECFKATSQGSVGGLYFLVTESGGGWTAQVFGEWPSGPPAQEGDVLRVSVVDRGDGRTLADTELTLATSSSALGCIPRGARDSNCTVLAAEQRHIDRPRACVKSDCDERFGTMLVLPFDAEQLLTPAERAGKQTYLARACQDARCFQKLLVWAPGEWACAYAGGSPAEDFRARLVLQSREETPNQAEVRAWWKDELGEPGAGTTYSLALHRGEAATSASLITAGEGPVEVKRTAPMDCDPRGLLCEHFYGYFR